MKTQPQQAGLNHCRHVYWTGLCLLFLCLGVGCQSEPDAKTSDDKNADHRSAVRVQRPERRVLRSTTTQPVTIYAYYEAEIYAKVSGTLSLENLEVDIGREVGKGAVLAKIDVPEMVQRKNKQLAVIHKLEAEQDYADAHVAVARAEVKASEAQLTKADKDVAKTKARLVADKLELDRVLEMVRREAIAQRLGDESQYRYDAAKSAKESAEANVLSLAESVKVSKAKLRMARANVDIAKRAIGAAKGELAEMDAIMEFAVLKAPFKGTVVERNVEPGNLVRNSEATSDKQPPLFVVADLSRVRARVAVPERDTPFVKVGAAATLNLPALRGKPLKANVSRIAHKLDDATRTMLVEIDLPNDLPAAKRQLLPGMFGTAAIALQERSNCLALPAPFVRYDESGASYVLVVDNGRIQSIPVSTGLDDGETIEILSGLSGTEQVVEPTARKLRVGQEVRIVE